MENKNRDLIGKIFFAFSIIFVAYLFITPLNHIICQIDEFFMMTVLGLPLTDIITVTANDVHPPLFYLMAKVVTELSGIAGTELLYSLNLLSICGTLLILITAATEIRKEYGWLAGGLFAFAICVMCDFSRYHLISRMYTWTILFVLITFLFSRKIINNDADKKSWIFLTIFSVLSAYTHYFGAMTSGCIYLTLLVYLIKYRKQDVKIWAISTVAAILLYVPWISTLINQLISVHNGFWITDVTLENTITYFGYYAYNHIVLFSIFSILVLIIIIAIYKKESGNFDKKDQFIILSGFGVYLGTIILGIAISKLFTPIMDERYLMPAGGILWLTISIILSKIENRQNFLILFGLISILLISGVANTICTHDSIYESGTAQKEIFDNITQDNNSMVIIITKNDTMYYLYYSNITDMYVLNESSVFGVSMDRLHNAYDFKNVDKNQIDELISNNTDKNIYVISWTEAKIKTPLTLLHKELLMHYYKV